MKSVKRGKFIVLDGTDGTGKSTQTKLLVEVLKGKGFDVEMADFPQYGQKSAGMVEDYLNGKYGSEVDAYVASVMYALDRYDASFKIRDWLSQGKIVVSNRYVTANAGHQGGKIDNKKERIKFFKWLDNLEYNIFKIPKPNMNLILHIPADISQKLVDKKPKQSRGYAKGVYKKRDIHEKDLNHLKRAEAVFLQIADIFPNTNLIECMENHKLLTPEEVHHKILNRVKKIIEIEK
ncbi:MAG: thymidylate kinase [Candidatus Doudnabacteria bacterium]